MAQRIIGQCGQSEFADIDHLVDITDDPSMLDVTTLTESQKFAFRFMTIAFRKGISWSLIRGYVKQVLFWGDGDKATRIEVKLFRDRHGREEFAKLWREL